MSIIAIHGAGMSPAVWDALARHVPLRAQALPGHGDGARPLPSIAAMADWVKARIDGPCVLLGHSMGALVALEAADSPLVEKIVLMGAAAEMPVHPDLLKQAFAAPAAAAELILKWGVAGPGTEARESLRDAMILSALGPDLAACHDYKYMKKADKPALVLAGSGDKMVKPAASEALSHMFSQGKYQVLTGAGHMMMAEDPAATAAALKAFL